MLFQQGSNWGVDYNGVQIIVGPQDVAADLAGYINDGGTLRDWYDLVPQDDDE